MKIYLDHAATTATRPEVVEKMLPYFTEYFANPSAVYSDAVRTKEAISQARRQIAATIGADAEEIIFTSGGTESDNMALRSILRAGDHLITTEFEHHAILHTAEDLEAMGVEVTYVKPDSEGMVGLDDIQAAVRDNTKLVSVMLANNEIGTLQDVSSIGAFCREAGILFHTDAVQAYGHLPIQVKDMNLDLMSVSGHKFYGPKGIGFLYKRRGIELPPILTGGGQERDLRSGTENVAGIVGLAEAATFAMGEMEEEAEKEMELRDYLARRIQEEVPEARINGAYPEHRLPNNLNITFPGLEGESILIMLDMEGIAASSGSACSSGAVDPSHVLRSIGLSKQDAQSTLRFTVGRENTKEEMEEAVKALSAIVGRLKNMQKF